jgi:mannose/fructose/N-acetylgalactosamine-specific phosphotransferase system component IIC
VRPAGIFGAGIGFEDGNSDGVCLVWYFLFIVFVTYAMLPLPLRTCMILGCTTALFHVLYTSLRHIASPQVQYHSQPPVRSNQDSMLFMF